MQTNTAIMHLSVLSPTIPHPGYIGAMQGDLTPTNCPRVGCCNAQKFVKSHSINRGGAFDDGVCPRGWGFYILYCQIPTLPLCTLGIGGGRCITCSQLLDGPYRATFVTFLMSRKLPTAVPKQRSHTPGDTSQCSAGKSVKTIEAGRKHGSNSWLQTSTQL